MIYESSYTSGRKPFLPDRERGQWATPGDFMYACLGLALRMDVYTMSWLYSIEIGIVIFIPYLICLLLFIVPLMVLQSFLGQFSRSGFISAFRVSPAFKGIGYISLALNILVLAYYIMFASVPLFHLINAFRPTLPWSCEAFQVDIDPNLNTTIHHTCDIPDLKPVDSENSTLLRGNSLLGFGRTRRYHIPSVLYFTSQFGSKDYLLNDEQEFSMSWSLVACTLLSWCIIAGLFYRYFNTAKLGQLMRYTICLICILLAICLARFLCMPGTGAALYDYLMPKRRYIQYNVIIGPVIAIHAFGIGWGTIITLASFNRFRTNITQNSWLIAFAQMGIFLLFGLTTFMLDRYYDDLLLDMNARDENIYNYVNHYLILMLSSGSVLATLDWANLWCILYYSMLCLAALLVIVTQLHSILTSIFDEFEQLRARKLHVTLGLIGFLAICSMYFCSSDGFLILSMITFDSILTEAALNLLLLLVVLWVYGRVRFQRDIEFMLGKPFATWKVYMIRFVSPILLLFLLLFSIDISFYLHIYATITLLITAVIVILLPWLAIPIFCIVGMLQSSGGILMRFKRVCEPTDWYPVDPEDRQQYEETVANADITQQLNELAPQVL